MSDSLRPHVLQPTGLLCPWQFFRQGYWSGLPCPPPGDLPNPGIESRTPVLQADSLLTEPPGDLPDPGIQPGSPALQVDSFFFFLPAGGFFTS